MVRALLLLPVVFVCGQNNSWCDPLCRSAEALYIGSYNDACLKRIVQEPSQGLGNENALKILPDKWHSPALELMCDGKTRKDLTRYSALEFYIRTDSPDSGNPSIRLENWNKVSKTVNIKDYIVNGRIDNSYRSVSIPLRDFATSDWDLGNVERIVWNTDSHQRVYYISRMVLKQTNPVALKTSGSDAPYPETNRVLRLTLSKRGVEESVRKLDNYALSSTTDPAYLTPRHPVDVGIEYHVVSFTSSGSPVVSYHVYLALPKPLINGNAYHLEVSGISDDFCNVMVPAQADLEYNDQRLLNQNIKINQEGYLPESIKTGYFGGYLGDMGGGVWTAGTGDEILFRNSHGRREAAKTPPGSVINCIGGIREDDLFAVGNDGLILHWNGLNWTSCKSPTQSHLFAVSIDCNGGGLAVGREGAVLALRDNVWSQLASPTKRNLRGVLIDRDHYAWVVGDMGTIIRWDGSTWTQEKSPTNEDLYAISRGSSDRLWAVGNRGTVIVFEDGKWKNFPNTPETGGALRAVVGDEDGRVWICGDGGLIWKKLELSDTGFVSQDSHNTNDLVAIAREDSRKLWIVGSNGTVLSCSYPNFNWRPEAPSNSQAIRAVFSIPYGALRLPASSKCVEIRDADTQETIKRAPIELVAANWDLSGEDVYRFDFSSVEGPGNYQAYIPGVGHSDSFRVNRDVLDRPARVTGHSFYYQRCGTALIEPFAEARFVRPICHEFDVNGRKIDGAYHESLPGSALSRGEKPGDLVDVHGGWHDAGDYGKYIPTGAAALWTLFTGYEIDPDKFRKLSWNIPESGNGIPDILNEAKWELDWIARMQAEDGGVYHKLTSQTWFEGLPQDEQNVRYIFSKTTHDTAISTAVFASAARLWKPYDPKLAQAYLNRALRGWDFLQKHTDEAPKSGFTNPPGNATGEYRDSVDEDNRLWAAAELYRTTGLGRYGKYFEAWWNSRKDHSWGWNEWQDFYRCAYWAYLRSDWPDADRSIKDRLQTGFIGQALRIEFLTNHNPYKNGARLDVHGWIGWGAFTQSSRYSFQLLQAWALTKEDHFVKTALLNLDTQLGANPLSMSFITGLGKRPPKRPLHQPSLHYKAGDPVPGLPVFGVASHLPNNQHYYIESQKEEYNYPYRLETSDPCPILRRYVDTHELVPMSEFTVLEMAVCAVAFNLLGNPP
jgi:hypothetical protein